jgi:hypothetical protein
MKQPIQLTNAIPSVTTSISRSPSRRGFLILPLVLAWFALSPPARGVTPAPDGGYPVQNTAEGTDALFSLTTGSSNTAVGFEALFSNTTGSSNTANGNGALYSNTDGGVNTANGAFALFSNTTGFQNTANGGEALHFNTTGGANTADGFQALLSNTTGSENTANGAGALASNTSGSDNTANGFQALLSNTTGINNTATGYTALYSNTTGRNNTANGDNALAINTTGGNNTAMGFEALLRNTTGQNNMADGQNALKNNTTGDSNIALGRSAGADLTTGNKNIDIGNVGVAGESDHIRIGKQGTQTATFIAGISGATVAGGVGVIIGSNGHLGTVTSSERFKDEIKPMDKASEAILALQPVTFRYKHELDPEGIPQFGLVAEQVEKVNPDLVARDDQGKVYTVRYDAVNAMLLNEFLKEHRNVQELQATVVQQKKVFEKAAQQQKNFQATIAQQQSQIKALTTGLQKVSDQLEVIRPAPQMVADNQ